jgi:hypothetical protein
MNDDPVRPPSPAPSPTPPRLLDQLRQAARLRGHPETTVRAYADCCRRYYIFFHGKRHPRELGLAETGRDAILPAKSPATCADRVPCSLIS